MRERGSQVISTRYPFRVDAGFLVRKRWEWTGFSPGGRCALAHDQRTPDVDKSTPDFLAMSELFAGKVHQV